MQIHPFGEEGEGSNLITTIHQVNPSTLLLGSYPSGIHIVDTRRRYGIVGTENLPKAPSAGQATPLCIRNSGTDDQSFLVCGRFPSVLLYDLRYGLQTSSSVYSGAESLSSLTNVSSSHVVAGGSYRGILGLANYANIVKGEALWNALTLEQ
jgi:hypothetical protein